MEGDISIALVTFSRKTDGRLSHHQGIQESSSIKAIIEVTQIIDEYSIYAVSSILENNILIEFESAINYEVGERRTNPINSGGITWHTDKILI